MLFGSNHASQLGARAHYRAGGHHVIHSKAVFESHAIKVCCGMDHTVLLLASGQVVTFGLGCDGQLGLGNLENSTPQIVPNLKDIVDIHASADWTLALDKHGDLWAWGNNEYNQVSDSAIDQVPNPTKIIIPDEGTIKQRATMMSSTATMGLLGKAFYWFHFQLVFQFKTTFRNNSHFTSFYLVNSL